MKEILLAETLITPEETVTAAVLVMEDGLISAVGTQEAFELPRGAQVRDFSQLGDAAVLAPGLVDVHVHGGAGYDLMSAPSPAERADFERHLARHAVTSYAPTTVTAPWAATLLAVEQLALPSAARGARSLGLHLEGPFLSPVRRGVHPESELLLPTLDRLEQLWQAAGERLAMITLAPELEGAAEFIAAASARGICVSLGHSDATAAQARAGVRAGARHVTHTFNAMRPLHQRQPGLLGEALCNTKLSAEMIADGIHVDPMLVEMFLRLKGPEGAVLVSDGISAAGRGDGSFTLGGIAVEVREGRCQTQGTLAGSVLTLDQAVRNAMRFGGLDLAAAWRLASLNPAQLLRSPTLGRLVPGAAADVAVLTPNGEVMAAYAGGRLVEF